MSAPPAGCELNLPQGTRFELRLLNPDARELTVDAVAELNEDGSFETQLTVPEAFPPGAATIFLVNYEVVDWCPGYAARLTLAALREASCASYQVGLQVGPEAVE